MNFGYFISGVVVTVFLGFIYKKYVDSKKKKSGGGGGGGGGMKDEGQTNPH